MADIIGYYIPKFYNEALDDPLLFDSDSSGLLGVQNNIPPGFIGSGLMPDAQNRLATSDGINRPRPGRDLRAMITNCTGINGACQLTGDTQLIAAIVSGAATWWSLVGDVLTNITAVAPGGYITPPLFNTGNNVYMVQGLQSIYMCWGSLLYKWDGTGFKAVPTSPAHPNFDIVTYFTNCVIGVESGTNTLDFSAYLNDASWDTTNLSLQLDQFIADNIVGVCPYQGFNLVVFKHSSIYLVDCNPANFVTTPTPSIANFPITVVTKIVGAAEHRTICQAGNDVIFLSESGRGVYTVGQILTNETQAIKNPISLPVKGYINRINWQFVHNAEAVVWDDLYLLSVPLDGSSSNNFILVYNLSLGSWQGVWTNYNTSVMWLRTYDGIQSEFYFADHAGNIYKNWYASSKVFLDTGGGNIASGIQFYSSLTSRAYRMGETFNKIEPFSWIVEFTDSDVNVNFQLIADTSAVGTAGFVTTNSMGIPLPFNLPVTLPSTGNVKQAISARPCGICTEHQIEFSGIGSWSIIQLSSQAWVARPNIIQQ